MLEGGGWHVSQVPYFKCLDFNELRAVCKLLLI
jgi:hypothetical protein